MDYAIAGAAAFVVSIMSGIAGGGGGLVMAPLLLLLGFSPQTVLATSKAGGLGLNIGALSKFVRQKGLINWRWAVILSVLAVAASLLGTRLVFILNGTVLKHLIVVITLSLVVFTFFQRKTGLKSREVSKISQLLGATLYFIVMCLQAGLGSGIGMLLMFVLIGPLGFDALHANATKRVAGLVLVVTSFIIFAISGYVNWALAASMGFGMIAGGYFGARLAIKHGNKLVKNALLIVVTAMGIAVLLS